MPDFRGLLIPHPRIHSDNLDDTLTTATQAGPVPGHPVDQGSSDLLLRSGGALTAAEEITLDIVRGGFPGAGERAARWTYTRSSAEYYWDPPGSVSGFEFDNFKPSSGSGTAEKGYEPHLARLADGRVLAAVRTDTDAGAYVIRIRRFDPDAYTWTTVATVTDDVVLTGNKGGPCLVVLPDGRVHLYAAWVSGSSAQIALWHSDDSGDTWALSTRTCLYDDTAIDLTSGGDIYRLHLRGAENQGQVLLIGFKEAQTGGSNDSHYYVQMASGDGGHRFTVEPDHDGGTLEDYRGGDVIPLDGGGFAFACKNGDNLGIYEVGSAFDWARASTFPLGDPLPAPLTDSFTLYDTSKELHSFCMWKGEDGAVYLAIMDAMDAAAPQLEVYRSNGDLGDFQRLNGTATSIDGPEYPIMMSAVETRGLTVIMSEVVTDDGTLDDGTTAIWYLGGHTTDTLPSSSNSDDGDLARAAFSDTYFALSQPESTNWTKTGAGTATLTADGLSLSASSGQTLYYAPTTAPAGGDGVVIFELDTSDVSSNVTATAGTTPRVGVDFTYYRSASFEYRLTLHLNPTSFTINDYHGASQLAQVTAGIDLTDRFEWRIMIYRSRWAVWYRPAEDDGPAQREWTLAGSGESLTSAASGLSACRIWAGIPNTATSGTHTVSILRMAWSQDVADESITTTWPTSYGQLGRQLGAGAISIPSGLEITALAGLARPGDQWVCPVKYQFGLDALDTPQTGRTWRSTADNVAMDIVWDLVGYADDDEIPHSMMGAALLNSNLRRYKLIGRTNAGTDFTLAQGYATPVENDGGPSNPALDWERTGNVITCPDPNSGDESLWIARNELAGAQFVDNTSGDGFRIIGNSSGIWAASADKPLRIFLDPDDDPSGLAASGTGYVHLQRSVTYGAGATADIRYLKLEIPSQVTREGYYEIGALVIGPALVFGRQYDADRGLERAHQVDLTTRRDGSRVAHSRGAQRRAVTVSWSEGIDESELWTSSQTTRSAQSQVVTAAADTARLTEGIFSEVDGPLKPVVYLSRMPVGESYNTLVLDREFLYGRIVSQWSGSQSLGDEGVDEVIRVGELRIEEEL